MTRKQFIASQINWACGFRFHLPGFGDLPHAVQTAEVSVALRKARQAQLEAKEAILKAYSQWSEEN